MINFFFILLCIYALVGEESFRATLNFLAPIIKMFSPLLIIILLAVVIRWILKEVIFRW